MLQNRLVSVSGTVLLLAAAAALASCSAEPYPGKVDPWRGSKYPNINVLEGLGSDVQFDDPSIIPSRPDRPMTVSVPARNATTGDLNIQYHYVFLDKYNRELLPDTGWHYETIPSSAQRRLAASAIDTTAVDWRLEVRKTR
jgi:hypothetical protein